MLATQVTSIINQSKIISGVNVQDGSVPTPQHVDFADNLLENSIDVLRNEIERLQTAQNDILIAVRNKRKQV